MLDVSLSASLHIHGGASTIASPDRDGCLLRTTSLRVRVLPALGRSPVSLALQATAGSVALYHSRSSIAGDAPAPRALLVEACGQGGGVPTSGGLDVLHVMTEAADGFLRSDTDVVLRGAGVDGGGVSGGCSFGWWSTVLAPLGRLPMAPGPRPVPDATSVRVAASGIALLVGVDGQGSRGGCFGGVLSSGSASWAMEFPGPDAGGTVTHAICLAPVALWVGSAAYWGAHAASQPDSKLWHLGAPTRRRGWSKVAQDDHLHATIASSPQGLSVSVRNSRTVASTAPEHLKYLVGVSTAVSGRHTPPDAQNGATAAPVAEPDGARAGAVPMSIPSTRLRGREKTHPRDLTGRSPPGAHALLPRGAAEPMLHRQAAGGAWAGEDPGGDIRPQWQTLSVLLDGTDVLATPPVPELHVDEAPPAVPDEGEDEVGFDEDWVNGGLFPDTPGGSSASSSASEVPSSLSGAAAPARRARGVEEAGSPWEGASFYAGAPEPDRRGSDRSRLSLEEQQSQRGMKGLLVIEDYLHEAACGASRSGYVEDELVQALAGPDEQGRWMTTARVGGGELQGRGSDVAGGDGAERPIDPGYLTPRRGAAQEPARRARGPTVGDFGQVCRECFKRAPLPDEEAGHTVEVGVGPWDLEWTLTGAREDSRDSAGGEASGDEWVLDDGEQAPAVLDDARDVLVSVQGFTLATLSAPLKLGGDGAEDPGGTPSDRLFRACIAAQEVAVRDLLHPTSSLWHMAVGRLAQGDQLPDNAPPIVHVAMAHGPPGSVGGTVHVALQPIRVSVDQGLVCFLARAAEAVRPKAGGGGDPESAGEESALPAQGGVSAWCPTRLHAERTTALVSYRPVRAVDPAGLIQGNVAEFLNVIPLKGVKLTLRDATVIGAEDVSAAAMEAGAAWLRDIGTRQAHVFVAGLPPMRPLWRLGTAATRVVTRPLRELRGDDASGDPPGGRAARTRAARRLREAGADFVRCVASEALGAGASIAHGVVTLVAPGNRGHRSGPRLGEQGGVSQAMREASERLAEGLDAAARAVVGEPVRRYRQGEGIASAAAAAARGLPAAAGRGIVAGLQAAEAAMRGASRALDNRRRQ
ncbi:unnamed protein product [Pedinophyceae sp. YPF-701]|nr:unnamed protein product [Pedinophyceae sp. YPF-701]